MWNAWLFTTETRWRRPGCSSLPFPRIASTSRCRGQANEWMKQNCRTFERPRLEKPNYVIPSHDRQTQLSGPPGPEHLHHVLLSLFLEVEHWLWPQGCFRLTLVHSVRIRADNCPWQLWRCMIVVTSLQFVLVRFEKQSSLFLFIKVRKRRKTW